MGGAYENSRLLFFIVRTKVSLAKMKSLQIIENSTLWLTPAPEECKINKM